MLSRDQVCTSRRRGLESRERSQFRRLWANVDPVRRPSAALVGEFGQPLDEFIPVNPRQPSQLHVEEILPEGSIINAARALASLAPMPIALRDFLAVLEHGPAPS